MQQFTPFQYMLIAVANTAGHDKMTYPERIQWATDNFKELESIKADEPYLYAKAVKALRDVVAGKPTNNIVHFDAICSGIQLLSAMTGCVEGAKVTGLINTGKRPDAYTSVLKAMQEFLGAEINVERADVKQAVMTSVYGSKAKPKEVFGENPVVLQAFYTATSKVAPGAFEMLEILRNTWQPFALSHDWLLPDGFNAKVKVMVAESKRLEIDELDHHYVSAEFKVNEGTEKGLSNIANVTHSVDAYMLRSMVRACSYNPIHIRDVRSQITRELLERSNGGKAMDSSYFPLDLITIAEKSGIADLRILEFIDADTILSVPTWVLKRLLKDCNTMLEYKPFDLVTIHDSFGCLPTNMNHVRYWYNEMLARIAESDVTQWILRQLYESDELVFEKDSNDLAKYIREADYALS